MELNGATLKKAHGEEYFFTWYLETEQFLWEFLHFFSPDSGEFSDDIISVLQRERMGISKMVRQGHHFDFATKLFLRAWFQRFKKFQKTAFHLSFELSWQEKFAIFALIKKGLPISRVARLMGQSGDSLRFLLFNALAKRAQISEIDIRCGQRDCIRNDLYFVDSLLGIHQKDSLGLVDWKKIEKHALNCSRCYQLVEKLKIETDRVKQTPEKKIPSEFRDFVLTELGTRWRRLVSGEWFASLSLWLKIPLQFGIVVLVVMAVLASGRFSGVLSWNHISKFARTHFESAQTWVSTKLSTVPSEEKISAKTETQTIPKENKWPESQTASLKKYLPKVEVVVEVPKALAPAPKAVVEVPKAVVPTPIPVATNLNAVAHKVEDSKKDHVSTEKFFYRWGAYTKDLNGETTKILAILAKYQVLRSGELELGSEYKGGHYFHFSISKNDFPKILAEVKSLKMIDFSSSRVVSDKEISSERERVVFLLLPSGAEGQGGTENHPTN